MIYTHIYYGYTSPASLFILEQLSPAALLSAALSAALAAAPAAAPAAVLSTTLTVLTAAGQTLKHGVALASASSSSVGGTPNWNLHWSVS